MKKLPLSIQTFSEIIENNYLYIDKTKEIYNLITNGKYIFLSRPRRFGKSLLISTIEEIFLGNKELFKDLYIHNKIKWEQHPVIRIDFSKVVYSEDVKTFKDTLLKVLQNTANKYKLQIESNHPTDGFAELIQKLSEINKVVILIDEYDKPIIDHITDIEKAKENREILRQFYTIIKASDEYLKFVLLTGVSKFSKVSVFSGLNNILDITLNDKFLNILGFTQQDIQKYFPEQLVQLSTNLSIDKKILIEKIKKWYDGYSWGGKINVYNPYSILNLFYNLKFGNYWFATGTPTFLINYIKETKTEIINFESKKITEFALDAYDIENLNVYSLLFQTGYLTITDTLYEDQITEYTLSFPNQEVKQSLLSYIAESFTNNKIHEIQPAVLEIKRKLDKKEVNEVIKIIRILFAKIPYTLHLEKEAYYHSLFYMILSLIGVEIDLEVLTDKGRIDGIIELEKYIYIIEFKYGKKGTDMKKLLDTAIKQIKNKKYSERFSAPKKEIIYLAVGFVKKEIDHILI